VDLSLTETQLSMQEAFSELLGAHSTTAHVRAAEATGFDPALWERMAQIGLTSMGLRAPFGEEATLADMVVAARACGGHLASIPFVESVVAGRLLAAVEADSYLTEIADGTILPTLVLHPVTAQAKQVLVPAGAVADLVVLLDGPQLVAFSRTGSGRPHSETLHNFGSQPLAYLDLDDPALRRTVIAEGPPAHAAFGKAVDEWRVLTAAALDGLRARALQIGVSYVKTRKAFGVLVGSFQAVQHRLADMSVAGDGSELLVHEAAWAADRGQPDAAVLAAYALSFAARTAFMTCREALQFHGGYGVALEYDIQLFFRRAKAWPLAIGDPAAQEQRAARLTFVAEGN
jgi:alkylation response protein AidB-like acyl-CoA dehydrogenase